MYLLSIFLMILKYYFEFIYLRSIFSIVSRSLSLKNVHYWGLGLQLPFFKRFFGFDNQIEGLILLLNLL